MNFLTRVEKFQAWHQASAPKVLRFLILAILAAGITMIVSIVIGFTIVHAPPEGLRSLLY